MGHIVDAPDRQARYLQKAVELDPEHAIARQHLMRLGDLPVPAPVIAVQTDQESKLKLNGDEPSQNLAPAGTAVAVAAAANELPEWLQDLDNKQLQTNSTHVEDWPVAAGTPVREARKAPTPTAAPLVPRSQPDPKPKSSNQSGEVWLVRILVIMVIAAAIVLGLLVLLILI